MLPIDEQSSLEDFLNKDIVLKAAIKEFFVPLYCNCGWLLVSLTVAANTATHLDYQQLKPKYTLINGNQEESEANESKE